MITLADGIVMKSYFEIIKIADGNYKCSIKPFNYDIQIDYNDVIRSRLAVPIILENTKEREIHFYSDDLSLCVDSCLIICEELPKIKGGRL